MRPQMFDAVVESIQDHHEGVKSFRFRLVKPDAIEFEPGQFVVIQIPHEGKTARRLYSVASPPKYSDIVDLCIQYSEGGVASQYFWSLKAGDPVRFLGPSGQFVLQKPVDYETIFFATGTGVAPFRSMIHNMLESGHTLPIRLYFGTRFENGLLYKEEFEKLQQSAPNFHYVPIVSRPTDWNGETGHVQHVFKKHFPDLPTAAQNKHFYLCGWDVVVKAARADLLGWHIPEEQIHSEEW